MAKVRLHRCPFLFLKVDSHPCHRVQSALDEQGIRYEIVKSPTLPRGRRTGLREISGQTLLPVIEFEDGTTYRDESEVMAERIRAGRLFEGRTAPTEAI
jgi:glutathione S-transferase